MSLFSRFSRRFCTANKVFDPHPLSSNTSSSGLKNRDPILNVMKQKIPIIANGNSNLNILEIGSGKGMHINYFANHFRTEYPDFHISWQPTDRNADAFHVASMHREQQCTTEIVKDPFILDLNAMDHMISGFGDRETRYDLIFAVNVFHVASMECWDQFIRHSFYHLLNLNNTNRMLLIYGPFKIDGEYTSDSNAEFDEFMKDTGKNQDYYLKDVAEMRLFANDYCLDLVETIPMPSNNVCLVFQSLDAGQDFVNADLVTDF